MKDTSQTGLVSHTAVLNRLVELGFEVLMPWADHLSYDLAYLTTEEHHRFGFFTYEENHLIRVQVKTAWLSKDKTCLAFNTSTVSVRKRGVNKKSGYRGKAEFFAIYSPDTKKIYMLPVEGSIDGNMTLRFKSAGVIRSNGRKSWHVPYEEAVNSGVNYWWAEDYEL